MASSSGEEFSVEDPSEGTSRAASPAPGASDEVSVVRAENSALKAENEVVRSENEVLRGSEAKLRAEVSKWREESSQLKAKAKSLEERLREERTAASERKRKIKSYVESLDVEKARLEADIVELRRRAEASEARRVEAEAAAKAASERREAEAEALRAEAEASRAEAARAEARAEAMREACEELETHKAKRMTAKSEMVALARVLETERDRAASAERRVRELCVPRAIEQAVALRDCLSRLDELNTKAHGAKPKFRGEKPSLGPESDDAVASVLHEAKEQPRAKLTAPAKDAPNRDAVADALARLEHETEAVTAGLNLLAMTIDLLDDTLATTRTCPKPLSDCLDLFSAAPAPRRLRPPRSDARSSYAKIDHDHDDVL